jgi:hypothetical protein
MDKQMIMIVATTGGVVLMGGMGGRCPRLGDSHMELLIRSRHSGHISSSSSSSGVGGGMDVGGRGLGGMGDIITITIIVRRMSIRGNKGEDWESWTS